jgi:hypothetical protein
MMFFRNAEKSPNYLAMQTTDIRTSNPVYVMMEKSEDARVVPQGDPSTPELLSGFVRDLLHSENYCHRYVACSTSNYSSSIYVGVFYEIRTAYLNKIYRFVTIVH